MANTYTQIYILVVFAVQGRQNAGLWADSPGQKVSVSFPTPIHSSAR